MRRLPVLGALALTLALPATSQADRPQPPSVTSPGDDGCLVVSGANGVVSIWGDGALIGRVEQGGTVTVEDLNQGDTGKARVFNNDSKVPVTKSKTRYTGLNNLRFRFTGGGPYHVVIEGIGIDLSAVGSGRALLNGSQYLQQGGSYSADAGSLCASGVKPFPDAPTKVTLGTAPTG